MELKHVRLGRFGREPFTVDKGAVRRLDVLDVDLVAVAHTRKRQSTVLGAAELSKVKEARGTLHEAKKTRSPCRLQPRLQRARD